MGVVAMSRLESANVRPMLPEWGTVTSASLSIMVCQNQILRDADPVTVILVVLTTTSVMWKLGNVSADQTLRLEGIIYFCKTSFYISTGKKVWHSWGLLLHRASWLSSLWSRRSSRIRQATNSSYQEEAKWRDWADNLDWLWFHASVWRVHPYLHCSRDFQNHELLPSDQIWAWWEPPRHMGDSWCWVDQTWCNLWWLLWAHPWQAVSQFTQWRVKCPTRCSLLSWEITKIWHQADVHSVQSKWTPGSYDSYWCCKYFIFNYIY